MRSPIYQRAYFLNRESIGEKLQLVPHEKVFGHETLLLVFEEGAVKTSGQSEDFQIS